MPQHRQAYASEHLFGPPSEPIDVARFIRSTSESGASNENVDGSRTPPPLGDLQPGVGAVHDQATATECDLSDMINALQSTWDDVDRCTELMKETQDCIDDSFNRRGKPKVLDVNPEIQKAKDSKGIRLASWDLPHESTYFVRGVTPGETNALTQVKPHRNGAHLQTNPLEALVTVTIYTRPTWARGPCFRPPPPPTRSSQHIFLASHTLQDVYRMIPCTAHEIPDEVKDTDGTLIGYRHDQQPSRWGGCVLIIEGVAYADSARPGNYADKLLKHIEIIETDKIVDTRPVAKSSKILSQVSLASLSPRINEPYFLLHHGNCEHWVVVEQIRLPHPTDPPSGYPLTTFLSPTNLDVCRACNKPPGRWSIIGDIRLGESPCILCDSCWAALRPLRDEDVVEVPLPKHEIGWE